jgi:hypothetical protein
MSNIENDKHMNHEYELNDVISEKDGELSPVSRGKNRRLQSPKKNKFKLPDLKLQMHSNPKTKKNMFKMHVSQVNGVVTVVNSIAKSTRLRFNMNRSLMMRPNNHSPMHNKDEHLNNNVSN